MPRYKKVKVNLVPPRGQATDTSPQSRSGPVATRTRAGTKSPQKRPTNASLQASRAAALKRRVKQPGRPQATFPIVTNTAPQGGPSPVPDPAPSPDVPIGRVRVIPDHVVSYSQRRDEYDIDVDPSGVIIDGPSIRNPRREEDGPIDAESPNRNEDRTLMGHPLSDEEEDADELDDMAEADFADLSFPNWNDAPADLELFQGDVNGEITDVTPLARAARILNMAGIPVTSPSATRNTRTQRHQPFGNGDLDADTSNAVENAFDVLDQHRARRQRPPPRPSDLTTAAARINPSGSNQRVDPSISRQTMTGPGDAAPSGRYTGAAGGGIPGTPAGPPRIIFPQDVIAAARRQASSPIGDRRYNGDESNDQPPRQRRSGNPVPHQMYWHTPHSREFHRWAKSEYSFRIVTECAYPTAQERLQLARSAYDSAIGALPELAQNVSGVAWSIEKMRLYTDTAWVRRGVIKNCASTMVFNSYHLGLTPAIAAQMPGGATSANQIAFTAERVAYLFTEGHWLRGRLTATDVQTSSIIYAHPIFGEVIEETIYRPATRIQRAKLSPMPLPTLALVATAVQCALEEWASGYRKRVPFTEESYGRVYALHMKRLNRAMGSHRRYMEELLQVLYDNCVSRNEPLPNQNPQEDEFDDLDVILSDLAEEDELYE
ncbi:hypothetical protein FRC18_006337, partial [Serendipita sp. 400]